jgi:hypothetical protein
MNMEMPMQMTKYLKDTCLVGVIFLLMMFWGVSSVAANTTSPADTWQSEFTLYGWLPSIDGSLKYDVPPDYGDNVSVDASDIQENLNFVFMGNLESRYNKISLAADLIYMDISNSKNTVVNVGPGQGVPLNVSGGLSLSAWVITAIAGYDLLQDDRMRVALIGGLRYLTLDADTDIAINGPAPPTPPPAHLSDSEDFWDGIIGVKGAFMLNENWYIPYYADVGAGDSELTWQLYAGIGYLFSWGDIKLGYRFLEYDLGDDKFVQDLKFYGPLLGIGFRF